MEVYRHGDIILKPTNEVAGKTVNTKGGYIVAYGEVTGHHHQLSGGKFKVLSEGERRFLIVELAASLTHQEHGQITVKPGKYEIVIQRTFDYEMEQIREVQD